MKKFSVLRALQTAAVFLLGAASLFVFASPAFASGEQRIAYYGNWDLYQNEYYLKDLDTSGEASHLTALVYSFENIDPNTLKCFQTVAPTDMDESDPNAGDGAGDAWADYQKPFSATTSVSGVADNPTQPLRGNFNQLRELKAKYPNLKIIVSIGGWEFSKYFSDAAATPASRQALVSSCIDMYIKGNLPTGIAGDTTAGGQGVAAGIFDGIDIDWEFPASANGHLGNHTSPDNTANYTALLQEFRSELDAQGATDGKHYILTAAVPSGGSDISKIQVASIAPYLDWIDLMSYDMHGSWETNGPTNFLSPLFPSPNDPSASLQFDVQDAAQRWVDGGFPKSKIMVGLPFYWRGWSGVPAGSNNGLYQSATGPSPAYALTVVPGVADYKSLLAAGEFSPENVHYDSITHSPWIYDNGVFYTGDTPESLTEKAAWIRSQGYGGAMIYSMEGDDPSGTLLKSVTNGLNGGAPAPIPTPQVEQALSRTAASSPNTATNGEPINMIGGNYLLSRTELKMANRDLPMQFSLSYNSAAASLPSSVGFGWTYNYRITARVDTDGSVVIQNPDGRLDRYTPDGSGGYTAPSGIFDTLASSTGELVLTAKDGTKYAFNSAGLLATTTSENGNTVALTYDANNFLTKVSGSTGKDFTFAYNDQNEIVSVTDSGGRTVEYTYDPLGNLVEAKNPDGGITKYEYDSAHHITKVTDPRGNTVVTNTYDDEGRVTKQVNGLGDTITLSYSPGETTFTDANGGVTHYFSDADERLTEVKDAPGGETSITYDAAGNPEMVTDPLGHATTRTYDTRGNLTGIKDALGGTQTFTYDSANNLLTSTDQLGHTTKYTYDTRGNVLQKIGADHATTTFAYDSSGEMKSVTDPFGNVTGFVYDGSGNQVTKTDPENHNTYYDYDAVGRQTAVENAGLNEVDYTFDAMDHVTKIDDPEGGVTIFTYDADGNKASETDANGHTTTYTYDANNQLTKVTDANGGETTYVYDGNGNLISKTDANGHTTTYTYDALDRQTKVTDPLGKITQVGYDAAGNVTSRTNASNRTTTYSYDADNRLITTTYPDATTVVNTYDAAGNLKKSMGAAGTTTYTYDLLDQLLSETNPNGETVHYQYNRNGDLTTLTYPDSKIVHYSYNAANQLMKATDWNGAVTTYAYNQNAQLKSKTLPNGITATYTYDANGNLTNLTYKKGTTLVAQYDYTRGNMGRITEDNETTADGTELWTGYTYDALGQLTKADAPTNTYLYSYDKAGNRTSSVNDDITSTYSYNAANQLLSKDSRTFSYDPNGNEITDNSKAFTYDYDNRLTGFAEAAGTSTTATIYGDSTTWNDWSWDTTNDFNETSTVHTGTSSLKVTYNQAWGGLYLEKSPGVSVSSTTKVNFWVRSSTANPTIEIDLYGANDTLIGYVDVDDYLPSMSQDTWYHLSIPLSDFGTASTVTGFSAMDSTTGVLYFDDITLTSGSSGSGDTITYTYDASGNRIGKSVNGTPTEEYVNAGDEQVIVSKDLTTSTDTYFLYGSSLLSEGGATASSRLYPLTDGEGNVRYLTDSTGNITASFTYDPFGNIIAESGTTDSPFTFQTEHTDEESGLTYLRARSYDPTTGRFISRDPLSGTIENPATQNGYDYAEGDPINLTDPLGLSPCAWGSLPGATISQGSIYGQYSGGVMEALNNPVEAVQNIGNASLSQRVGIGVGLLGNGGAFVGGFFTGAGEAGVALIETETKFSSHALERMTERGVTPNMAKTAIRKGQKFYDPLNNSINYILPYGFASGKSLLVGTNPFTKEVTTVIRGSKSLIRDRFTPM
ncbi:MAG TPA: glycosyl hydrolase family 18 protein [Candidatus Paceibacterota bacterium]|nr:glycosyl hydrolase family 18 protein [Candidatus Paceibacterota bacterium]